jgi:hypothetical protein
VFIAAALIAQTSSVHAQCAFDLDASSPQSTTSALTDAALLLRHLRGATGNALTAHVLGSSAQNDANAIAQHIATHKSKWDFDGDGFVNAASDGVILARYLLGFRGTALTLGTAPIATPTRNGDAIVSYIAAGCPQSAAPPVCTAPISLTNTSSTSPRVGNGTPGSCTQSALQTAVNTGGIITFDCGAAPATINITTTINVPPQLNTVIDGGGKITLDGGGTTRILRLAQSNYRTNSNGLTLQRITLANGKGPGTGYVAPNPNNAACAYGFAGGSGGAIEVRDARLHVIDVDFIGNAAATPGPDVGGGAIYSAGALELTVVNSRFISNSGSNAGAIGLLQTNGRFYNNLFENNSANGTGQNFAGGAAQGCPGVGHPNQGGAGGNGGAIAIDGSDDTDQIFCGNRFVANQAEELAGAIFRTANVVSRLTTIDRTEFSINVAKQGGALFISNSQPLNIVRTLFNGNTAIGVGGAAHFDRSRLNIENTTFAGNVASNGLGGAIFHGSSANNSVIRNVTFANNRAPGGAGFFSAAIAGAINFPINNTVFANNTTADNFNPMQCWFQPGTSGSNNVQWPRKRNGSNQDDTLCVNNISFNDPLLAPLANNGGATFSLLPASNSPLIGAGANCPNIDQRGAPRNTSVCTIGAVER